MARTKELYKPRPKSLKPLDHPVIGRKYPSNHPFFKPYTRNDDNNNAELSTDTEHSTDTEGSTDDSYNDFRGSTKDRLSPVTYSSSALQSINGRVGNILPGDLLVTSPNADVLYFAPITECRVRMRQGNHFGCHDPLLYPQPFLSKASHLAVIKTRSLDPQHKLYYAWVIPADRHFQKSSNGMCCLGKAFHSKLEALANTVLKDVPLRYSGRDEYLLSGSIQIKCLLDLLPLPASREEHFLRAACLQRHILELNARNDWLGPEWRNRIKDAKAQRRIYEPMDIVGAFIIETSKTENLLSELDMLFYSGIPVWYVRPMSKHPKARIDQVVPFASEDLWLQLSLPSGHIIDCNNTIPAHQLVYYGLAEKPECYIAMSAYICSLFKYSRNPAKPAVAACNNVDVIDLSDDESEPEPFLPSPEVKGPSSSRVEVIYIADTEDETSPLEVIDISDTEDETHTSKCKLRVINISDVEDDLPEKRRRL